MNYCKPLANFQLQKCPFWQFLPVFSWEQSQEESFLGCPYQTFQESYLSLLKDSINGVLFCFVLFCFLFMTTPAAYGSFSGQGLDQSCSWRPCHSHDNTGSKPHLGPMLKLVATWVLNPLSEARDGAHILTETVLAPEPTEPLGNSKWYLLLKINSTTS